MNERIEHLALKKSFAQLTEAERAEVLAGMPAEVYEQWHALLHAAPTLDPGPGPNPTLRNRLLMHIAGAAAPARRWPYHILWWQAAAAMAATVAATLYFQKPTIREVPVAAGPGRADTVYIEKPLWRERVVWREKVIYLERPVALAPTPPADSARAPSSPGTSLEKEPVLMQFFVQVR